MRMDWGSMGLTGEKKSGCSTTISLVHWEWGQRVRRSHGRWCATELGMGLGYWMRRREGRTASEAPYPRHWRTCFSGSCGWQVNRQCLPELVFGITGRVGRKVIWVSVAVAGALLWGEGWDWIWRGGQRSAVSLAAPWLEGRFASLWECFSSAAFWSSISDSGPSVWPTYLLLGNCALSKPSHPFYNRWLLSHFFTLPLCPFLRQWDWLILAGFPAFLILFWFSVSFTPL